MEHVTGIFNTRFDAERTITDLEAAGVRESQISLLMSDDTRSHSFKIEKGSKADEGAAAGAAGGGLVGAVLGGLMAAGAVAIPGMNLIVSGYLISALAGLGAGAATGGLIGALVGAGITEHEAKVIDSELREGNILLAVEPKDTEQKKRIQEILKASMKHQTATTPDRAYAAGGKRL